MSELRIGFVTQTHTGAVTPRQSVEWADQLGYDFVEIYLDGSSERTSIDAAELGEACADAGLDVLVHLPFLDLDLGTPRDRIREASIAEHEAGLDFAAELDAEKAVLHASTHATPPEWPESKTKPRILESVRELDAYAADRGIELCVENLPGIVYSIVDIEEVLEETEASLTIDTGHARVSGYDAAQTARFIETHRDRISHVHVNDARGPKDEHVPVGSGNTDFKTIFEPLVADWEGTLSVEAYTFDLDYMRLSKEKLEACLTRE